MQALLAQPLALTKLGAFLRDVFVQGRKKPKALILVGPQDAARVCLVVAVIDQPTIASVQVPADQGGSCS